jgi:hypothetical protein
MLMELVAALAAAKTIMEIGQVIAGNVEKANKTPDTVLRILIYLESVQVSVEALGLERQRILTDARGCDLGNAGKREELFDRLNKYLHEDNIRTPLRKSLEGLSSSRESVVKIAVDSWRRKHKKREAVNDFLIALDELKSLVQQLENNFYPGEGSGMGVVTLVPIFNLVEKTRFGESFNIASTNNELRELVNNAQEDKSNQQWLDYTSEVEGLVNKLRSAFAVKTDK